MRAGVGELHERHVEGVVALAGGQGEFVAVQVHPLAIPMVFDTSRSMRWAVPVNVDFTSMLHAMTF